MSNERTNITKKQPCTDKISKKITTVSNNRTKQVDKIILRDNVLKKVIHFELYETFRKILEKNYKEIEEKYFNKKWIKFSLENEVGYWIKDTSYAIPVQSQYGGKNDIKGKYFGEKYTEFSDKNIEILFDSSCPYDVMQGISSSKAFEKGHWIGFGDYSYCVEEKRYATWNDDDSISVGAAYISFNKFKESILSRKYEILDDDIFNKSIALLNGRSIIKTADASKCLSEKEIDSLLEIFELDRVKIEKEVTDRVMNNYTVSSDIIDFYINELLSCDKIRADLDAYDKKCIEDVNRGHWELWSDEELVASKGKASAFLMQPLIARNPEADIREDGLIGIDFGTKSTIVSKRDGREKIDLLRVGTGQLNKKAIYSHYENPTIMEFINLTKFISDYNSRIGRPETMIDDLRVSHAANNDLQNCTISDNFYSFFYNLKQWCGDTDCNIKIIDQQGIERVLPSFVNIDVNEFNPLELYAYYLGLYINNMRNGIYIDYVLSFPVTYEKKVKEKILDSFTRGLKKSLPETILKNEAIMSKFRVRQGVNEPAAYAITALQEYGFEPEDDENILYSIFDFGGGTTDFDFGLWRCADDSKRDERRYDYVIEHFGSEGDRYLGGENLLELLAFEVFKANVDSLGKKKGKKIINEAQENEEASVGFSFSMPKECDSFPGSESFISNSQEARRNTKQLMEVLRPFWEGIIGVADKSEGLKKNAEDKGDKINNTEIYNGYIFRNDEKYKFPIKDGAIEVDLFDKDGNRKAKQKLYIENKDKGIKVNLVEILENRIERGISNFFTSIVKAFRNESAVRSKVDGIQIFLAGNSSKSPILRKLFDEYIKKEEGGYEYYHLFPPLGTKEAFDIQIERGVKNIIENDITAPTGKTGVAYGLIIGREGGKIKVISEIKADAQAKFRFNIGIEKRGKFQMVLDRTLVDYGQWICLIDAGYEDFEIYYTSQPNASKMSVKEAGIYNKRCRLPYTDEEADVYIRSVEDSPADIEYCISKGEPLEDVDVVRVHLGE